MKEGGLGKERGGLGKECKSEQRMHFVGKYLILLGKENLITCSSPSYCQVQQRWIET